jgi:hypothetical protein
VPPPVIALSAGIVQHLAARRGRPSPVRKVAAGATAAGSIALLAGSAYEFKRRRTTVNPLDPSKDLTGQNHTAGGAYDGDARARHQVRLERAPDFIDLRR